MDTKLQRDVRLLKAYSIFITVLLGVIAFSAVGQAYQKTKFDEIDVGMRLPDCVSNRLAPRPGASASGG